MPRRSPAKVFTPSPPSPDDNPAGGLSLDPDGPVSRPQESVGPIRVYNKLGAKLFLLDGSYLLPRAEGWIAEADLRVPNIAKNVLRLKE